MKKIYNIAISLLILIGATACSDFLDEPKPTQEITANDVYNNAEVVRAYFSGIYRMFRSQYKYTETSSRTDAGGLYSMYYSRTVKGNDIIQSQSWYQFDYGNENREPNYARTRITWQYCYDIIDHANTIIEDVNASKTLSKIDKTAFIAEAKALRAYFYFQLWLEYYSPSLGIKTPPLYKNVVSEGGPMSEPTEYEELMLQDINWAIDSLKDLRINKSYINKKVASGIKARILMALNKDWEEVEKAAIYAFGGDAKASLDKSIYNGGFDDIENAEVLWGMDQRSDQTNYYYLAPHAFSDHNAEGYSAMYVNANFVNLFSETDIRNEFKKISANSEGKWNEYVTDKFVFNFTSDVHIMRTAEMVLIAAEAKFRNSDPDGAHELLYTVQLDRDINAVKSSNTGDALLEEILIERRKELYAEIGVEWFDAKRLGRGIKRDVNHRIVLELQPNDKRFVLKVPEIEYNSNDLIDESVNANR